MVKLTTFGALRGPLVESTVLGISSLLRREALALPIPAGGSD